MTDGNSRKMATVFLDTGAMTSGSISSTDGASSMMDTVNSPAQ